MYYICIADQGGRIGTVPDMQYHLPQQHLIRIKKRITNTEVDNLIKSISISRKSPKIVGSWSDDKGDGLPTVLEYEEIKEDEE